MNYRRHSRRHYYYFFLINSELYLHLIMLVDASQVIEIKICICDINGTPKLWWVCIKSNDVINYEKKIEKKKKMKRSDHPVNDSIHFHIYYYLLYVHFPPPFTNGILLCVPSDIDQMVCRCHQLVIGWSMVSSQSFIRGTNTNINKSSKAFSSAASIIKQ